MSNSSSRWSKAVTSRASRAWRAIVNPAPEPVLVPVPVAVRPSGPRRRGY